MATESHQQNGYAVLPATSPAPGGQNAELAKEEVGWYFVERYYNTLSKSPEKLYLLYNKRSQFVAGVEEEKVHVSIGLKAIDDRVKELNYQDCKVRITNVDSQSSDVNIVVQVIGEMTNESKPHRKFCQTFVLAPQPHGYFLLNDILRFIADEDDEPLDAQTEAVKLDGPAPAEQQQQKQKAAETPVEALPTHTSSVAAEVSKKSGESTAVNGHEDGVSASTSAAAIESEPQQEQGNVTQSAKENEPVTQAAKPASSDTKEAKPAAKPAASAAAAAPAPSRPAVPMSWAQRIGAGNPSKPAAAPVASTGGNATAISAPASKPAAAPAPAPANKAAPTQTEPATSAPARQASPANSAHDGSQGGWQTAGVDHGKTKSRTNAPTTENGHVRAYVKNVFQSVTTEALKAELSKYGELAYFDVSRQKNSAFVEFSSVEAFKACIAANPHQIGEDSIIVEERRPTAAFAHRGNGRGGRGGAFDGRPAAGRGGFGGKDGGPPRGQYNGSRGNRGGANGVAGRGRPQPTQ